MAERRRDRVTTEGQELSERVVHGARDAGADVIAAACPLCQANLDLRQSPPRGSSPANTTAAPHSTSS